MSELAPKKTILVSMPPSQYPICWPHIYDENESNETTKNSIPSFDIEITQSLMEKNEKITTSVKNNNSEDEDWEQKALMFVQGWTFKQNNLFKKVAKVLNNDRLARLSLPTHDLKPEDVVRMRAVIDKSAERMRKELAGVAWEVTLVQWLHTLLMEYLPPSLLAAYLDIMQTLKAKVPSLVDKMIFWKPGNVNQDLLASILKKPWQPTLTNKYRKLPANALIVVIPPLYRTQPQPPRVQRLFTLFTTMSPILPIQLSSVIPSHSLQSSAEQVISITRSKIQELKTENPDRRLLLIGMHSSAPLALQVALIEQVSGVVCFGFAYNTVHGYRGQPDDQILHTNCPVLLMIGQNAAKTNDEELEGLREKLSAQSTVQIAVVGGADDYLRVSKKKRRFEGVTQEMVDNMIVDEITDFATNCIQRPLPIKIKTLSVVMNREIDSSTAQPRKRKGSNVDDIETKKMVRVSKVKPPKIAVRHPVSSSEMAVEMAVQSITSDNEPHTSTPYRITASDAILTQQKLKQAPQFISKGMHLAQQLIRQKSMITIPRTTQVDVKGKIVPQQHSNFSPPKFTIVRNSPGTPQSIYDMPVVFADSEGNVVDSVPKSSISESSIISIPSDSSAQSSPSPSPTVGLTKKLIIKPANTSGPSQMVSITKNKNILIQKPSVNSKNMVVLNSIVGRPIQGSNVILPSGSAQISGHNIVKMHKSFITTTSSDHQLVIKPTTSMAPTRKIEILNHQVIKPAQLPNSVARNVTFLNLADAKPIPNKITFSANPTTLKNGQIIVKTSNLRPITLTGAKQFGNLTVSRINITPSANPNAPHATAKVVKKNP